MAAPTCPAVRDTPEHTQLEEARLAIDGGEASQLDQSENAAPPKGVNARARQTQHMGIVRNLLTESSHATRFRTNQRLPLPTRRARARLPTRRHCFPFARMTPRDSDRIPPFACHTGELNGRATRAHDRATSAPSPQEAALAARNVINDCEVISRIAATVARRSRRTEAARPTKRRSGHSAL